MVTNARVKTMLKETKASYESLDNRLTAIEALLETEKTWKVVADQLKEQNNELMDRLMAKDFGDYQTMKDPGDHILLNKPPKEDPRADEDLIGTVIDGND